MSIAISTPEKSAKIVDENGLMVAQWGKHLPSAQVMISEFWDGVPCWAPCSEDSLLLPLPLPLPATHAVCLFLSLSL